MTRVRTISTLVLACVVLAGCATVRESRLNPFNWFGRGAPEQAAGEDTGAANPLLPRRAAISIFRQDEVEAYGGRLIGQIDELLIERRPGGAIVRVRGIADRIGPYDVRLVPVPEESDASTLTFDLRNLQGPGPRGGTEAARSVTAAVSLSTQNLEGIRTIRVRGARNVLASRR